MSIPPVQIITAVNDYDPDVMPFDRGLAVNRAGRGDANVVISFWDAKNGKHRDAIGIDPDSAIEFAIALLNAAREVRS